MTKHEVIKVKVPAACGVSYKSFPSLLLLDLKDRFNYLLENNIVYNTRTGNNISLDMPQKQQIFL